MVCSLPMKSTYTQKSWLMKINFIYTCQPCLWHHQHRLSNTKWQHSLVFILLIFMTFRLHFKQDYKSTEKCCYSIFLYIPFQLIGPVLLPRFGSPLSSVTYSTRCEKSLAGMRQLWAVCLLLPRSQGFRSPWVKLQTRGDKMHWHTRLVEKVQCTGHTRLQSVDSHSQNVFSHKQ